MPPRVPVHAVEHLREDRAFGFTRARRPMSLRLSLTAGAGLKPWRHAHCDAVRARPRRLAHRREDHIRRITFSSSRTLPGQSVP